MKRCLAYITKIILPDHYSLLYTVYILFQLKRGDTTRNFNIQKCLHL